MNEHEEKTVEAFILKPHRARYRFLLDAPKRRHAGLDRLNHCEDLDPRYATWLPSNADVAGLLRSAKSPREGYVISSAADLDGQTLQLGDALDAVEACGWGTIVSCVPGKLAYYCDEQGSRRAILQR